MWSQLRKMAYKDEKFFRMLHRTSPESASKIREKGFDLSQYGKGAGAGLGEPLGIFLSEEETEKDFAKEVEERKLPFSEVLKLKVKPKKIWDWDEWGDDNRLKFIKDVENEYVRSLFDLTEEEANDVIGYYMYKIKQDPRLMEAWKSIAYNQQEHEYGLAKYMADKIRKMGYDAVKYKERFRGVRQFIVLDPDIIELTEE